MGGEPFNENLAYAPPLKAAINTHSAAAECASPLSLLLGSNQHLLLQQRQTLCFNASERALYFNEGGVS